MVKVSKRKAPSRAKYEQSHPTVSCRVPKDIYDRLTRAKQADRKSFTDILKVGLGLVEVGVKKQAEARKKGYDEGYKQGYAKAEELFKVTYSCNVCGKPMPITSEKEKKAAGELMSNAGWGHIECHEGK